MTSDVLVEEHGRVLVLTLNRPEQRNAVTLSMAREIEAILSTFDERADLSVGILTGAGGTFCAGMDLRVFAATGEKPVLEASGFAGLTKRPPAKPLIAAVEGYALAGGFEMVLSCDLVVAASDAQFGVPEVRRGLTAAAGGLMRLPRRIPYNLAMELILSGRMWSAVDAAQERFVNRLVEPGEALAAALALAEEIAANAPLALRASKQVVSLSSDWTSSEMFDRQEPIVAPVRSSKDAREGASAFVEKRTPVWQGR
jgi:enoyl-CoA hydratase